MNFSKHSFTVPEYKVLSYNSNFIPTPKNLNKTQLAQDICDFSRNIKLKAHFKNNTPTDKNDESIRFRPIPEQKWIPPKPHHTVNTFIESFQNQIKRDPRSKLKEKNNLSKEEEKALNNLEKRDDIIIINADKGGAITILDTEDYVKEAQRQLSDANNYKNF